MSTEAEGSGLHRRTLLAATGVTALVAPAVSRASDSTKTGAHDEPGGCQTPREAVARTRYGRVRGFVAGGVYTFKGVPYGETTAGANRWLPAKPPQPWTGERATLSYGANCPQTLHDFTSTEMSFLFDWDDGWLSEDMLKLNIWTPSLTGARPVMVYLHGGGFSFGSAYELPSHEGAQMARRHDVVQVSVNHRLNALGFLDVSEVGGEAYAGSVNVGMTDLVAALHWVRDNIAEFGGDPDRVMIYGQSGGGSKVTCLLGMPSAAGLMHRAAVQSGGGGDIPDAEQSREFSRRLMRELGVSPGEIGKLQHMDWAALFAAGNRVADAMNPPRGPLAGPGSPPGARPRVGWSPTLDGQTVTLRSFHDAVADSARTVPVMIGSVSEEGMQYHLDPTETEWRAQLSTAYGAAKADRLVSAMKAAHPEKQVRTLSYGVKGLNGRNNVQRMVDLKLRQGGAPVYQYWFSWQSPQLDGVGGAWHTSELAFCFDNTKRCEQGTGDTPGARALAAKMAGAWAAFARTGDPSQPGLAWAPTSTARRETMVFDTHTRMENDPEGAVRRILLD